MLLHIPGILDAQQLAQLRQALDAADWTDGRETVGAQGARVKRNLQLPDASPLRQQLAKVVLAALAKHPLYHAAVLPARTLPPRFNRYEGGGHYGFHVDGSVMALPDGAQVRSDVSCTLFLNGPDEYDGGELIVSDTYGEHEVKLPAGDAIVYPSSSLHRVAPVTRGARLASFFWVQSLVRDDGRRRLLFELDTSIQRLTTSGADADAVLRLTGVYHNLLRAWAET
ncbi:Fe2+-dependent dioxygenase [Fulvimonas soli]|jgi:PKHD-type hydroxylase|uniref:PKHD-type hydroxylase n=1 Tax=Fulvimonas soli TaxID=155197 RepID=A0A316IER1_9GAMM|nr:Fe2+-dependent dioxygenase [Fulvimonas soli]PWK92097.1 PKHD-type hydroxylase [Fulvimonas soli]TNY26813.1 Fe2+-dependent dioxygenase [Fulvimonas soli]